MPLDTEHRLFGARAAALLALSFIILLIIHQALKRVLLRIHHRH